MARPLLRMFSSLISSENSGISGRVDTNPRERLVTSKDARDAIDAPLSGRQVRSPSVGCSTPEFQTMYRMFGHRAFQLVTVSINYPDERPGVLSVLNKQHATSRNFLLGSSDIYSLLAAFDADWNAAVPYTALIRPGGEVVYKRQSTIDPLKLRRLIIANLANNDYIGHQTYWQTRRRKMKYPFSKYLCASARP